MPILRAEDEKLFKKGRLQKDRSEFLPVPDTIPHSVKYLQMAHFSDGWQTHAQSVLRAESAHTLLQTECDTPLVYVHRVCMREGLLIMLWNQIGYRGEIFKENSERRYTV